MVETERNFSQVNMEELLGYSTVVIQPVFCIAPEALNSVDMIPAFRLSLVLSDHHVVTPQSQRGIGMPVVRVVETARFGIMAQQSSDNVCASLGHGKDLDDPVALQDPEDKNLPCRTPAPLAGTLATEGGFIAFDRATQRLRAPLIGTQYFPNAPEKSLGSRPGNRTAKSQPVGRNSQNKILQKSPPVPRRKPKGFPHIPRTISASALPALTPSVIQFPCPVIPAPRTLPLHASIIPNFGPVCLCITQNIYNLAGLDVDVN